MLLFIDLFFCLAIPLTWLNLQQIIIELTFFNITATWDSTRWRNLTLIVWYLFLKLFFYLSVCSIFCMSAVMIEEFTKWHKWGFINSFTKTSACDVSKNPDVVLLVKFWSLEKYIFLTNIWKPFPLSFKHLKLYLCCCL